MVDAQRKDLDKIKLDMDECRKKLQNQKIPSAEKKFYKVKFQDLKRKRNSKGKVLDDAKAKEMKKVSVILATLMGCKSKGQR